MPHNDGSFPSASGEGPEVLIDRPVFLKVRQLFLSLVYHTIFSDTDAAVKCQADDRLYEFQELPFLWGLSESLGFTID